MKITSVELKKVCGLTSQITDMKLPEIILAGRSNVGKSSFVNAVTGRKSLARISGTPGKTRTINYYEVNNKIFLVDLPGYGYAKCSGAERKKWAMLIEHYLHTSQNIVAYFMLLDVRRQPSADDMMMYQWIRDCGGMPTIIVTKIDKIKKSELEYRIDSIRKDLDGEEDITFIPFSALNKDGVEAVRGNIGSYIH